MIQSGQVSDSQENYQVTLARLEEIVAAQLITADDALEDWRDIVSEDIKELNQERQLIVKPKNKETLSSPGRFSFLTEPTQSVLLILNFTIKHNEG